jgi:muramoyltetrapeptide carboxypeptidase
MVRLSTIITHQSTINNHQNSQFKNMKSIKFPPPLKQGDLLEVIAPSGTIRGRELDGFQEGLEIWRKQGYNVKLGNNWNAGYGYLAGDDVTRRNALAKAWENPDCKGILCVRGGYGSARLLENWSWKPINQHKWVIGFSDVTGLLWSLFQNGLSSVHGPVLTTLAQEPDWSQQRLFDFLTGKPLAPLQGKAWGEGVVTGVLLPANLTVATHLLGTPLCPSFDNVILALEDVNEAPYRIDRMLTQWRLMGVFNKVKGIALGRFSSCDVPSDVPSFTIEEILRDRLGDLNLPIVSDLPFGHDGVNPVLPVGSQVELDGERGILSFSAFALMT